MKFFGCFLLLFCCCCCVALTGSPVSAQGQTQSPARVSDIPAQFKAPNTNYNYTKRVETVPMRDGVKLYTVIVIRRALRTRRFC